MKVEFGCVEYVEKSGTSSKEIFVVDSVFAITGRNWFVLLCIPQLLGF